MVTPFKNQGADVDLDAMKRHVNWLLDKPVDWLFPISGLGQWRDLSLAEKQNIILAVITAAKGRIPIVAGVTSPKALAETLILSRFAREHGAQAISVAVPDYLRTNGNSPSQQALYDYFKSVHDAADLPILIYDAKKEIFPETALLLSHLPRIKGLKYRNTNIEEFLRMTKAVGNKIAILAGVEHMGVGALAAGAVGFVGGGANIFPQLLSSVIKNYEAGDLAGARADTYKLIDANDGIPGATEIKYALDSYYSLSMEHAARDTAPAPLTLAQKDRIYVILRQVDPKGQTTEATQLASKHSRYLQLIKTTQDADGFVHGFVHSKCDTVTLTSLACIAQGLRDCPVYKAQSAKQPGLWFQNAKQDCFDKGEANSDNSPDVFVSLGLLFWNNRDLASVNHILRYGEKHRWIMGRSQPGFEQTTVAWDDDLKALYYELQYQLGGTDTPMRQKLLRSPEMKNGKATHLAVNRLLLIALMTGMITAHEREALKQVAKREPHNALYQAIYGRIADGDEKVARHLLLDASHFPELHLPDNSGPDFLWATCILTPECLKAK